MSNDELMHYGVLGMKWGVHRTPEQLGSQVSKLDAKNKQLERRAAGAEAKAATYKVMSRKQELKSERLSRGIHLLGKARAQSHAIKATKLSIRSAEFERSAARARNTIQHNKHLQEKLNGKISELSNETVQLGADFLERHSR